MNSDIYPSRPILLVDDDTAILRSFDNVLRNAGINNILKCSDSREVADILSSRDIEVMLLDLSMPQVSGKDLLSTAGVSHPDIPAIIVTAAAEIETAVECMKYGAFDYILKPVDQHRLVAAVRKAIEMRELRSENANLKRQLSIGKIEHLEEFSEILTNDDAMLSVFRYIEAIAPSPHPVFITGETGVGKELVARSIHRLSGRKGSFVPVNTAGLDDTVFADTFFGHVRGAYTGADGIRAGLVESAANGTLFMDEIGDLSSVSQVKLLRFLQDGDYYPLGTDKPRKSTARVVVSTNRDVCRLLAENKFREDLYYRLMSHHVRVPPLRERLGDMPLLVNHFLDTTAAELGKKRPTAPRELITYLSAYHFPGNIRELRAMIHDAVSNHESGVLSLSTFVNHTRQQQEGRQKFVQSDSDSPLQFSERLPTIDETTILLIKEAMKRTQENQRAAAQLLGISRQSLNKYWQKIVSEKTP